MDSWKTKAIIGGVVILVLSILVVIIKVQYDMIARLRVIEKSVVESKDLGDNLVRSQASYITKKDLETIIKQNGLDLKKIKDDMAILGADVKALNVVTAYTPGFNGTGIASTNQGPRPVVNNGSSGVGANNGGTVKPPTFVNIPCGDCQVPQDYLANIQYLRLDEPMSDKTAVPFGEVGFDVKAEKPWTLQILPRSYQSVTVLGQDEEGRHFAYSKFNIKVGDKTYSVPIQAQLKEEYPDSAFRFDPRLYLSTDVGLVANKWTAELMPGLGISLLSYGKTKANPTFSFLTVGLGYATQTKEGTVFLSPVNYNLHDANIPLIQNLQVGPSVSAGFNGDIGLYLGIRVGL
jgi:hypothetical protein